VRPLGRAIEEAHAELLGLTLQQEQDRAAPKMGRAAQEPHGPGKLRRRA